QHNAMALQKAVIVGVEVNGIFGDLVWSDWLRLLKAVAEAPAENLVGDGQLVSGHVGVGRVFFGVDVNELHHPVAVGAGGGSEEARDDVAYDRHVILKRVGLPSQHVGPQVNEALVPKKPSGPALPGVNGAVTV